MFRVELFEFVEHLQPLARDVTQGIAVGRFWVPFSMIEVVSILIGNGGQDIPSAGKDIPVFSEGSADEHA